MLFSSHHCHSHSSFRKSQSPWVTATNTPITFSLSLSPSFYKIKLSNQRETGTHIKAGFWNQTTFAPSDKTLLLGIPHCLYSGIMKRIKKWLRKMFFLPVGVKWSVVSIAWNVPSVYPWLISSCLLNTQFHGVKMKKCAEFSLIYNSCKVKATYQQHIQSSVNTLFFYF